MRISVSVMAAALALLTAGTLSANRAVAMAISLPVGLSAATASGSLVKEVRLQCYSWQEAPRRRHRQCWNTPDGWSPGSWGPGSWGAGWWGPVALNPQPEPPGSWRPGAWGPGWWGPVGLNPQPEPPGSWRPGWWGPGWWGPVGLNPQPLPPFSALNPQPLPPVAAKKVRAKRAKAAPAR